MTQTRNDEQPLMEASDGAEETIEQLDRDATVRNAFELWFEPEIERRRAEGRLPEDFVLMAAQVIMNVGAPNEIRLNSEVSVVLGIRLDRNVEAGEPGRPSDLERIEEMYLSEDRDPNAGHVTLLRVGERWCLYFDMRYNAARVTEVLDAAEQFLEAAREARARGHQRVFAETLFAAAELGAKAQLLQIPDERFLKKVSHAVISTKINFARKLGNADATFVATLNRLESLRPQLRYMGGPANLDDHAMTSMEEVVRRELTKTRAAQPKRVAPC